MGARSVSDTASQGVLDSLQSIQLVTEGGCSTGSCSNPALSGPGTWGINGVSGVEVESASDASEVARYVFIEGEIGIKYDTKVLYGVDGRDECVVWKLEMRLF